MSSQKPLLRGLVGVVAAALAISLAPQTGSAQVLCVRKVAQVKSGAIPLGSQVVVRNKCRKNEVTVLNIASLRGPQGDAGAAGPQGAQGAAGAAGSQGATGAPGVITAGSVGSDEINQFEVQRRIGATCSRGTPLIGISIEGTPICDNPVNQISVGLSNRVAVSIRTDGRPVVAFDGGVIHVCADEDCTSGTTTDLGLGIDVAMALRSDNRPVVAVGSNSGDQRLVICGNETCTAGNVVRTLFTPGNGPLFPIFSQIAVNSANIPYVSFWASQAFLYVCSDTTCSSGQLRQPSNFGTSIIDDLEIRPNGSPVFALRPFGGPGGLYDCDDSTCSSGSVRSYATSGNRWVNSVAVRANNRPVLLNYESTSHSLRDCGDAACTTATTISLDPSVAFSILSQRVTLRPDGRPLVAYGLGGGSIRIFDCANTGCTSGTARTLDATSGQDVEEEIGVAVRSDGRPVLVYQGASGMQLLSCKQPNCS